MQDVRSRIGDALTMQNASRFRWKGHKVVVMVMMAMNLSVVECLFRLNFGAKLFSNM